MVIHRGVRAANRHDYEVAVTRNEIGRSVGVDHAGAGSRTVTWSFESNINIRTSKSYIVTTIVKGEDELITKIIDQIANVFANDDDKRELFAALWECAPRCAELECTFQVRRGLTAATSNENVETAVTRAFQVMFSDVGEGAYRCAELEASIKARRTEGLARRFERSMSTEVLPPSLSHSAIFERSPMRSISATTPRRALLPEQRTGVEALRAKAAGVMVQLAAAVAPQDTHSRKVASRGAAPLALPPSPQAETRVGRAGDSALALSPRARIPHVQTTAAGRRSQESREGAACASSAGSPPRVVRRALLIPQLTGRGLERSPRTEVATDGALLANILAALILLRQRREATKAESTDVT